MMERIASELAFDGQTTTGLTAEKPIRSQRNKPDDRFLSDRRLWSRGQWC